ncbi:hypothetical protein DFJ43DRAFT_1154419 [Lentinula guzmanii]|uniref:Uncharacterized protein n=1 Tax=Lentinula guzmanii TaxID=2804957 RepID=A0AA38JGY3_9AGAR|nr:hypothetical protein DFJ43DRAFT_1154419 [Lentinula guzmanii]
MSSDSSGLPYKPPSTSSLDRAERARRRSVVQAVAVPFPVSTLSSLSPPLQPIPEVADLPVDPSPITTEHESLPVSRVPSPASSISSTLSDMARNISGSGWVDMGTLKSGCQLLTPNPTLDALEELWGYVITNLDDRDITEEAAKKKEFLRCFAKWGELKDSLAEISLALVGKSWIELSASSDDPDDFACRPFFDTIRDKLLGKDWARIYDLRRDRYHMLADPLGFSKLVTLMETHNRRLRGTMYHRSNEVLQTLIMQKLPEKFRADLRDCKVSEQLPYAEWKIACKDVEERRPPMSATYAYAARRPDSKSDKFTQSSTPTNQNTSSGSMPSYSMPRSHRFPNLQVDQKKILSRLEGCFRCYNLFAGHLSNNCSNAGPPTLSVPYRPLNDADIALATKIHNAAPDNSIPYELILKRNVVTTPHPKPVAAIQDRIALTEIPNLDLDQPEPTFDVQRRDVAAVFGSHEVVHFASGSEIYGTALGRGFDYDEPAAAPIRMPVATLVPARRSIRDARDDGGMGQRSPYSPLKVETPAVANGLLWARAEVLVQLMTVVCLLVPVRLRLQPTERLTEFLKVRLQSRVGLVSLQTRLVRVPPLR